MFPAALQAGQGKPTDTAYQEGAEYLRSIGIESQGELMRILDVAMNPNSLFGRHRDKKRAVNASVSASRGATVQSLGFMVWGSEPRLPGRAATG